MKLCSIDGCGRRFHARKLCSMHLQRLVKHGDPLFDSPILGRPLKGEYPTFGAIHKRLSRQRGPAKNYSCVDCRERAAEWSYEGGCPHEMRGMVRGSLVPYSENLDLYVPRCVRCHRVFDRAGEGRIRDESGRFTSATVEHPVGVFVVVAEDKEELE